MWNAFLMILIVFAKIRRRVTIVRIAALVSNKITFDTIVIHFGRNILSLIVPPLFCIGTKISQQFSHYNCLINIIDLPP